MNLEVMQQEYGDEYPDAVTMFGVWLPLARETRFHRYYRRPDVKLRVVTSRFHDGSVAITLAELTHAWPTWSEAEREDFCTACGSIPGTQADLPDILRFVMQNAAVDHLGWMLQAGVHYLPPADAFALLVGILRKAGLENTASITQAIAATRHPDAARVLRKHLDDLWDHPRIWEVTSFLNGTARDATWCVVRLLELGAPVQEFEDKVRKLSAHPCAANRDSCSGLHRHYPWLPPPEPPEPFSPDRFR